MNDYYSLRVEMTPCSEDATDLLAAYLADEGYESFVPDSTGLTAYIKEDLYKEETLREIMEDFPFETEYRFKAEKIEGQDWNHEWEKHYFQPIVIADRCVVRSSFHKDAPQAEIEILIDPKMAFGTGHHATTTMMATRLLDNPPEGQKVVDMGTGTGLLAILAKKLGAADVTGIEIDPAAYENSVENARLNRADIRLVLGDARELMEIGDADVFLANINRNIILGDLESYRNTLRVGGSMYLSGFYKADADMIAEAGGKLGLERGDMLQMGEWACLKLTRKS